MRKFKCIKHYKPDYAEDFTVGKIYKCNELGQLVDNGGFGWGWLYDEDVEDVSCRADNFIKHVDDCVEFEEVPPSTPKITVKVDGRKTIACMWLDGKLIKKRFCVCHKDDEYDYAKGVEIAVKRLFDWDYERQPKIKFEVNDKVEITDSTMVLDDYFEFFDEHCPQYASRFAYGYHPKTNEFGEVVFVDGTLCVVKLASTSDINPYILVNSAGLRKI